MDRLRRTATRQQGFTVIEVLVAMTILLIGVLTALSLVNRANATTVKTRAREGATNLAREVIEGARSLPYGTLDQTSVTGALQAMPGLGDSSTATGWQIVRRGFTYNVSASVCIFDDPKDNGGAHDAGSFCADSAAPTPPPNNDKNPEDYKRVRIDVTWTDRAGVQREVHQTELINNPGSAGAPAVRTLALTNATSGSDTIGQASPPIQTANFALTTSSTPATLHWLLDGASQGPITTGSGLAWTFQWPLGDPTTANSVVDGTYVVSAEAFDRYNTAGPSKSLTVKINRRPPEKVAGVAGGRTADPSAPSGQVVYIEWLPNRDLDIAWYTVFRRDASGNTPICTKVITKLQCIDRNPPTVDNLHYFVVAYDMDPYGNERAGDAPPADGSGDLVVTLDNKPPYAVQNLTGVRNADGTVTLTWTRPSPADPDAGDSIDFYRIYRDGVSVGDSYARWDAAGTDVRWVDGNTGGTQHTYWVTAVDSHYGESPLAGPVTP